MTQGCRVGYHMHLAGHKNAAICWLTRGRAEYIKAVAGSAISCAEDASCGSAARNESRPPAIACNGVFIVRNGRRNGKRMILM